MAKAYLSLGANIGDARAFVAEAIDHLAKLPETSMLARSSDYRTPPWGKTDQDWFINAAVVIETKLSPHDLIEACLSIETGMGRRRLERWGPRLIDIDIIAYEGVEMTTPRLTLPHGHALERVFVLQPLSDIAPDLVIRDMPIRRALAGLDPSGIERLETPGAIPPPLPQFDRSKPEEPGLLVSLSPLIRRIVVNNPGPFTFTGTCTYVVGRGAVTVIDPGPEDQEAIDILLQALGREKVARILVTHTHRDHSPGARLLQQRTGAPILGCAPHFTARALREGESGLDAGGDREYRPNHELADGELVQGADHTLEAVHTPGHTANHIAFALKEENILFSGDHVMAWSTSVVAPPDGAMSAYMQSLEKLRTRSETLYWPGHGGPVRDPQRFLRGLVYHRRMREVSILNRLRAGDTTIPALVETVYENLNPALKGGAALSLLAHLEDLETRKLVRVEGIPGLTGIYRPT